MKKFRLLTFTLLVAFLATSVGINAQETVHLMYNPDAPAGTATPFDGWGDVKMPLLIDAKETNPDSTDIYAYYQAFWDASNLYFYFNVVDDTLVEINPKSSWNGDAIELAISLDDASYNLFWGGDSNDDGKLTFTFTDNADSVDLRLLEMSGFAANGGTIDSRTSATGYEIALKVPIASIGDVITDLTTLESIRIDVAINDRDDMVDARQNQLTWSGTTNNNTDVSGFGTAHLGRFADDPVSGHSMNYSTLIPENWEIIEFSDGNIAFGMNTSSVNPIHSSGNPWADPDGPDGPYSGGQGSGLGDYATLAANYSGVKLTAKVAKPNFDKDNSFWDMGIIWGMVDDTKYNYVNLSSTVKNSTAAAVVDNEGIRDVVPNTYRNENLVMFDDTLLHEIELSKVGNIVIVKYEGNPAISMDAADVSGDGMVGIGSWNDGVIFDDVVVEVITEFGASTDNSFTTSIGTLVNDTIEGVPEETTVQELLDALTLAAGASAIVVDKNTIEGDEFNGFSLEVSGDNLVTNTMRLLITAEAGNMMESGIMTSSLSSDASIAAYFSPIVLDSATMTISTIEGTTLGLFLSAIRPLDGSTEAVLDADLNAVTDEATEVVEGMIYRVTAEDGTIVDYPISTYPPAYPTYSAQKVDADHSIIIDAWFDDWADYGDGYAIEQYDAESETLVPPSSPEDLSATVKMAWDDDYLYMYFHILDDITSVANAEHVYLNDGIEIAFVMTDDIALRPAYNMFWMPGDQPGNMKLTYNPGMSMAQFADGLNTGAEMRDFTGSILEMWELEGEETGYELEFKLAWSTLNGKDNPTPFVVAEKNQFSLNVAINDVDGGEERESILFAVLGNTNLNASEYPLVRLDPFGGSTIVNTKVAGNISIYPNPVADFMTISGVDNATHLEISNITGQIISRTVVDAQGDMSLNVSSLTSGLYILKAVNEKGTLAVGKFYKK